jgi:type II secretory pathway component PulJ
MVARRSVEGLSLVELLIAVAILTMLIGLGTVSFSLFTSKWDALENAYQSRAADLRRVTLLHESLKAAVPLRVSSDRGVGYYFLGDSLGFTFVSERPIFSRGSSAVVRVIAEREQDRQAWRLVYEEASLAGSILSTASQQLPFNRRLIVLSGANDLGFEFFGWRGVEERVQPIELGPRPEPRWFNEFDGIDRRQQPLAIKIKVDESYSVIDLPNRAEEWESAEVNE